VNPDTDLKAIDQLRQRGADLSLPHEVLNYFLCREEDSARSLANWMQVWGYEARVLPPRGTHGWEVRVIVRIEPSVDHVLEMRGEMERLARRFGGQYDGWEVEEVQGDPGGE
jgi:hypothetical protein